nr:ATP-binding protein [Mycobacterium tuberculosis]
MRVWKHVEAAVDSPDRCGVVLVGPHGVGKTLLAQLAAEQVMSEDGRSGRARWVVGTAPGRAIPFGAFRHLISLPASGADIGRPAALLRAARSSLTGDAGDLLLVVDDAHNLDPLSATLVYQLARAGAARLVVTVASEAEPPDAIAALWSDDLLTRVAIEPLDRAQTAAFVESALDASPTPTSSFGAALATRCICATSSTAVVSNTWTAGGAVETRIVGRCPA